MLGCSGDFAPTWQAYSCVFRLRDMKLVVRSQIPCPNVDTASFGRHVAQLITSDGRCQNLENLAPLLLRDFGEPRASSQVLEIFVGKEILWQIRRQRSAPTFPAFAMCHKGKTTAETHVATLEAKTWKSRASVTIRRAR